MYLLLTILLSFYPTIFIYNAIPADWMKQADALAPTGTGNFLIHFAIFAVIFFVAHMVFRKYTSLGYMRSSRGGIFGLILMGIFVALLALISFYQVLPGDVVYNSPKLVEEYVLKNPFTIIALVAPFVYLFFD